MADLIDQLWNIHCYTHKLLKLASACMKTCYNQLANCAGYQKVDQVWLYHSTHTKGKSPKLQPTWEDPCKVVTQIRDVVYRILQHPRMRMMVVYLDQLVIYKGTSQGEQPSKGSS
jgi:hypothetical protein